MVRLLFLLSVILMLTACQETDQTDVSIQELTDFKKSADRQVWGDTDIPDLITDRGDLLYADTFSNLRNWHHEGIGELTQPASDVMQLNCIASQQGGAGCMAFGRQDFPDHIIVEYDLKVLTKNGLVITFVACAGINGEDMITNLPPRQGIFDDYIRNPQLKCYHVSISRYDDDGEHTGVSNWRRNPGIFLMAQQPDLCKEIQKTYHIHIVKSGPLLQLAVNDSLAGGFIDPRQIPTPMPESGKIGFRAIGSRVIAQIKNYTVHRIKEAARYTVAADEK
jgi:hypothetical protein